MLITTVLLLYSAALPAQQRPDTSKLRLPLPLDAVVSLNGHNGRSPVNVSPDGEWVAHTIETAETVPRGATTLYAATGFPFAEGNARMAATLSNTQTGEHVRLGVSDASSWAPTWSPDGRHVAFYSDEGDEAGLWLWERQTRTTRRVGNVIVRPMFGFETPRWSPDSRRLLVKLLPGGRTIAEANALLPRTRSEDQVAELDSDMASVVVRRSTAEPVDTPAQTEPEPATEDFARRMAGFNADLALIDVRSGSVQRLVRESGVRMYAFSPDGRSVGYSVVAGIEPNNQQNLFEIRKYDLALGTDEAVVNNLRMAYGIEWSWSPDGRYLAHMESGVVGNGSYSVISVQDGSIHPADAGGLSFDPGDGEVPPIWSQSGNTMFGVADGALWAVRADSPRARAIARSEDWQFRNIVTSRYGSFTAWSGGDESLVWVFARKPDGTQSALLSIDVTNGDVREHLVEDRSHGFVFSQAATDDAIVFTARDQRSLSELWMFDPHLGDVRQVSQINATMGRYELGETELIQWQGEHGDSLAGALLLPPGYETGTRLPLVVWVYGGRDGSTAVNRFGLVGSGVFNMQILATRGYGVLFPDAPVREGSVNDDLVATVLPGVEAAIAQGYADSSRIAVMGQSYGSINTLALLTRTNRFKAAVITAAVLHPDLVADYLTNTGYYERGQGNMGGTVWEYPDRYLSNSPIFDFPNITTPLLIGQGDRDGNLVPSEAIFTALERLGKEAEYRVYQGEGHVITRRANVIDFWERRLNFLAKHLELQIDESGRVAVR